MRPLGMSASVGAVAFVTAAAVFAQDILVRLSGDHLQISAPNLHFISGKPLESLKNGASVPFDIQVSVLADGKMTILSRSFDRFVVSYDVWEEKFSVARMRSTRAAVSHLSANSAEAWCFNKFTLPVSVLPQDKPFWIRIDVRAQDGRDRRTIDQDSGMSISTLIDIFSRPARSQNEMQWRADSAPIRLADLRRAAIN